MMKREMTSYEKAQRRLERVMQNGISTKKLLLLGGITLLALLGITMSGSASGRHRLMGGFVVKYNAKALSAFEKYELVDEYLKKNPHIKDESGKTIDIDRLSPSDFDSLLADAINAAAKPVETEFKRRDVVKLRKSDKGTCLYAYQISKIHDGTYNLRLHRGIVQAFNKKLDGIYKDGVHPPGFPEIQILFPPIKVNKELIEKSTCSEAEQKKAAEEIFALCKTKQQEAARMAAQSQPPADLTEVTAKPPVQRSKSVPASSIPPRTALPKRVPRSRSTPARRAPPPPKPCDCKQSYTRGKGWKKFDDNDTCDRCTWK